MKVALFLPLAYIAGEHGFALFAPYLGLFLATAVVLRVSRRRPQAATNPTREM